MIFKNNGVKTILVIVPHQDDEINLIGGLFPLLLKCGADVHVLYITNGDVMFNGAVRIGEGIDALKVLGVKKENIHILGYLDSSNTIDKSLYRSKDIVKSKYSTHTYGGAGIVDYGYIVFGEHGSYTYANLKRDLRACFEKLNPDVIFATDFDGHHDHRLCSMVVDEVVNDILLAKNNTFNPWVYRGFAYSTAFRSEDDFYCINIKDTVKPAQQNLAGNTITELDNPVLGWEDRIQFPVAKECASNVLKTNILYEALKKHFSQCVSLRSKKIINADKVFWERPASNLLYKANITVSSGQFESFLDFRWFDINNIGELKEPLEIEYIGWEPDENDISKTLSMKYVKKECITTLNFYIHTINEADAKFYVSLNGNIVLTEKDFQRFGKKYCKCFDEEILVDNIDITLAFGETKLMYAEILPNQSKPVGFAKLKLNGNFAYNYIMKSSDEFLRYDIYNYGLGGSVLQCTADNPDVVVEDEVIIIPKHIEHTNLIIRDRDTGIVFDKVKVARLSGLKMYKRKINTFLDKMYTWLSHRQQKIKRRKMKYRVRDN